MKKFNINDYIYIQITEAGWKHLKETVGDEYIKHCIESRKVIYDNVVWYRLQYHNVIELFEPVHISSNVMFNDYALKEIQ